MMRSQDSLLACYILLQSYSLSHTFYTEVFLIQCSGKRMQARVNMQPVLSKNEINYGLFGIAK